MLWGQGEVRVKTNHIIWIVVEYHVLQQLFNGYLIILAKSRYLYQYGKYGLENTTSKFFVTGTSLRGHQGQYNTI